MPRRKRVRRTPNVYIDIADPVPRSPPKVKSEVVGVGESVSLRPTGTLRSPQRSPWIPLPPSQLGLQGLPGTTLSPTQSRSPRAPPKSIRKPQPQAQSGSPPESPYSLRASHPVTLIPVDSGESSDGDFLSSSDEYQPESDNDQSESDAVLWEESDDSDWEWTNIKTEPDSGMVRCESEDRIIYPTVSRKPVQAQKNKKKARNQTPAASKQISLRSSGLRTRSNKVYAPRLIDFSQRAHNGKRAKSHQHKKQSGKNSKRDYNPSKDFSQDSRKTLSSSDGNQEVQELEHHSDTADGAEEITEGGSAITDESQDQQESEGQGREETGEGVEKHEERLSRKQSTATSTRRVLSYSDNICILVHKTSMKQKAWCAFCGRRVSQLMQHLLYKHMKEEEVIDIFNCGVNTYKRKRKLQVISDKGLCQHNAQVLEAGSGTLIPLRTPGNLEELTLEQFCEGCYVFVEKNFVESHKLSCRRQNEQSMDSQEENNSDIEVLNVEPSSDDPLKITKDMIASVQDKLQQVSGNGQITILEKKHNASVFCVLCRITPCHFSRHMNQVHSDVPSVKKILEYPLGSKERKLGWTLLRNTFNFLHIREVLEAGSGQLMLTYVRKNKDPSQLKVCPTCYGLLFNIRPHLEKCQKLQPVGKVKSCECMLPFGEESSVEGGIPQTRANADQQEDQRHSASENRKNASEKGSINWQTRWDGKKKFRKINCCVYCQTPQYKMYKHYMQKHSSEEDVQKAIKYPKKSQQRRDVFSILILRGNNAHNKRILERGQGTLIPPRKLTEASTQDPEGELPGNLYSYCSECFARVRSVSMWAHAKRHRLLKEAVAQTAEKDNVRVGNRDNHLDGRAGLEKEKEPPEMLGVNNITSEREENVPCPQGDQNPATHGNPSMETVHQDRRESHRKQEEEGGREGQRKPEEEGGREGQRKPEEEGEREGQRKPEGKSGREGQGRPEEEGGREDQRKLEEEGGREGQGRPEEEGGREGQGKPEEEGGREGQRKPEEEGGRKGQGKPEEEGGREGQGKPEEEGGREGQGKPEEEDGREGQGKPGAANGCSNDVVMVDRVQETLSGQEREGEETTPEDQTINATTKYQTGKEYCIIMKKRGRQKIPFVLKYSESLPILLSTIRSYCLFCDTSSINMIKHLEDKHAGEREVQEAIRMPREFDAGKRLWSRLITRGNKEHNDRAMQAGCGELIPLKRFQGLATLQNYQFCFCCYMFIRKSQTMHKYFCKKSRRTFDDSEKEDLIQRRRAVENKNMCICKARSTSEATSETTAASREQQHSRRKSATNFHLKSDNAISFNQWQNRERRVMTKSNCCLYCQSLQTSMARHMVKKHSNEKEVKEALKHPKKSKVRRDVFSGLLRRGNYQHNQRVAHLGKGFMIPVVFRHQRVGDLGRYTHCDSCLGLFSRTGLVSHRRRGCHRPPGLNQSPQKMSNGREEPKSRHQPSRAASHQVKDLRCQADTEMLNASSSDTSDEEWDRTEFKRLQKAKQRRLQKRRLAPQDQSPEGAAQQEAPQGGTTSNQEGPTKAKRKMVVRKGARPWSSEELVAINSFFSDQIGELKVPGKQQCEAAKAKFAEALKGRDWRSIKFCVYNKIQTHRKQERRDGEDEERTERASDRRPWTLPEVRAVEKHMQTFITDLVTPGKLDCLRVKRRCGAALRDRSWKQIKFYVYNRILKKRKMQNND